MVYLQVYVLKLLHFFNLVIKTNKEKKHKKKERAFYIWRVVLLFQL